MRNSIQVPKHDTKWIFQYSERWEKRLWCAHPQGIFCRHKKASYQIFIALFTSISSLLNLQLSCFFVNFPAGISPYLSKFEQRKARYGRRWMHIQCSYSVRTYKWKILSSGDASRKFIQKSSLKGATRFA